MADRYPTLTAAPTNPLVRAWRDVSARVQQRAHVGLKALRQEYRDLPNALLNPASGLRQLGAGLQVAFSPAGGAGEAAYRGAFGGRLDENDPQAKAAGDLAEMLVPVPAGPAIKGGKVALNALARGIRYVAPRAAEAADTSRAAMLAIERQPTAPVANDNPVPGSEDWMRGQLDAIHRAVDEGDKNMMVRDAANAPRAVPPPRQLTNAELFQGEVEPPKLVGTPYGQIDVSPAGLQQHAPLAYDTANRGWEVRGILAGKKPAALINGGDYTTKDLARLEAAGAKVKFTPWGDPVNPQMGPGGPVIVGRDQASLDRLVTASQMSWDNPAAKHIAQGRALGYPEDQIKAYVESRGLPYEPPVTREAETAPTNMSRRKLLTGAAGLAAAGAVTRLVPKEAMQAIAPIAEHAPETLSHPAVADLHERAAQLWAKVANEPPLPEGEYSSQSMEDAIRATHEAHAASGGNLPTDSEPYHEDALQMAEGEGGGPSDIVQAHIDAAAEHRKEAGPYKNSSLSGSDLENALTMYRRNPKGSNGTIRDWNYHIADDLGVDPVPETEAGFIQMWEHDEVMTPQDVFEPHHPLIAPDGGIQEPSSEPFSISHEPPKKP